MFFTILTLGGIIVGAMYMGAPVDKYIESWGPVVVAKMAELSRHAQTCIQNGFKCPTT